MSTYKYPDSAELEFHAGTATRHKNTPSITAQHIGVQFAERDEDILLAALLFHACWKPTYDLSKVRCNPIRMGHELEAFMEGKISHLSFKYAKKPYSTTKEESVPLLCICHSPWIEGSTSKAIYGKMQREFNMHICCECGNWFHKYCLSSCGINPPKKTHDFICPDCKIPPTIPWTHSKYTNTCTSDNFFTILLLHCYQHSGFLEKIGCSAAELALKAAVSDMLKGNIDNGKTKILNYIKSVIGTKDNTNCCYGSEYEQCLQVFKQIWKLSLTLMCDSPHCPTPMKSRYPVGFNFRLPDEESSFMTQIQNQFPSVGYPHGYCGAKFGDDKPDDATCGLRKVVDDLQDTNSFVFEYECRGVSLVQSGGFLSSSPWVIPFNINLFKNDNLKMLNELPHELEIYGKKYVLAGYTLHFPGHYTAIVFWHGKKYWYDGLGSSDALRFRKFRGTRHGFSGYEGSHVFYFIE